MNLDVHTGLLSGTPTGASHFQFTIVTDNGGCTDTYDHNLQVYNTGMLVFPIPTSGDLFISFGLSPWGDYIIRMLDILDRAVFVQKTHVTGSQTMITLDLRKLAAGNYILEVIGPDKSSVYKIQRL